MKGEIDEMLMAYVDGELDEKTRRDIERLLKEDPRVRQKIEIFRQSADWLRSELREFDTLPVPERLLAHAGGRAAKGSPDRPLLRPDHWREGFQRVITRPWAPAALAASMALFIGFFVGVWVSPGYLDQPQKSHTTFLADVLEHVPAGKSVASIEQGISVTPQASFRTDGAGFCREYETIANSARVSGVACRSESGEWVTLFELHDPMSTRRAGSQYIPAEGDIDLISEFLDQIGAEAAILPNIEQKLLEGEWSLD